MLKNITENGWGYKIGTGKSHYMQKQIISSKIYRLGVLISACGMVTTSKFNVYSVGSEIDHCGLCNRVLKKRPELLGPGMVAGFWEPAKGMTVRHHWLPEGEVFKSRCGVSRPAFHIGIIDPDLVPDPGRIRSCGKCQKYVGVDAEKKSDHVIESGGRKVNVQLVNAQLTQDQMDLVVTGGRVLADPVDVWIYNDTEEADEIIAAGGDSIMLTEKDITKKKVVIIGDA